jgi:phosphatidylinositol glycan class O
MGVDARCRILAFFLYMLCLQSVAIFLFTRGFLLTRTELPSFSNCSDISDSPCFPPGCP